MSSFYFPFALTVGGMLVYHISQKAIAREVNPFHATMIAYIVGIVICAFAALTYPGNKSFGDSVKSSNWAVYVMGIGAAAVEVGFMLSYRYGWRISVTAVATNVTAIVVLIPLGILFFREQVSIRNILGVLLCIIGLFLVVRD